MKHDWQAVPGGYECAACFVLKLPPNKKVSWYGRHRYVTIDGKDRHWIGSCPGRTSPLAGDPPAGDAKT